MTISPDDASLDKTSLDNPIWRSLTTTHAHLAQGATTGHGLARRYPSEIGPLSAFAPQANEAPSHAAWSELAQIIPAGDLAILFLPHPPALPVGWQLIRDGALIQMTCAAPPDDHCAQSLVIEPMHPSDSDQMLALATLTEPGPFRAATPSLGGFLGVRIEGRLAAMAGRRLAPAGFAEVSAVCTHPQFRGRGLARALVAAVTRGIFADGLQPFLTSFEANTGAIRVYEQLGFVLRRGFHLAVVKPPA
jgi:ribosomal protein S18 acetylase RimI-like enzyme